MNQQNTIYLDQLMDLYMAMWNEPDAELRHKSITQLWVEDGAQIIRSREFHGYQELEERVTAAYETFVKTQECIFKLSGEVDAHHNAVKFNWDMVPAAGGAVLGTGLIFLVLAADGRIRYDYQF